MTWPIGDLTRARFACASSSPTRARTLRSRSGYGTPEGRRRGPDQHREDPDLRRSTPGRRRSTPRREGLEMGHDFSAPGRGKSEEARGGLKPELGGLKPAPGGLDPDHVRLAPERSPRKCDVFGLCADLFQSRLPRFRADLSGLQSAKTGADRTKVRVGWNEQRGRMERIGVESEEALVELEKCGVESTELHVDSDSSRFRPAERGARQKRVGAESRVSGFQSDESHGDCAEALVGHKGIRVPFDV